MAIKKPIVQDGGKLSELQDGDSLEGVPVYLPDPDELDESDATYFYFGYLDPFAEGWKIRRITRATAQCADADFANNGGFANLAAAWTDRATLTYV